MRAGLVEYPLEVHCRSHRAGHAGILDGEHVHHERVGDRSLRPLDDRGDLGHYGVGSGVTDRVGDDIELRRHRGERSFDGAERRGSDFVRGRDVEVSASELVTLRVQLCRRFEHRRVRSLRHFVLLGHIRRFKRSRGGLENLFDRRRRRDRYHLAHGLRDHRRRRPRPRRRTHEPRAPELGHCGLLRARQRDLRRLHELDPAAREQLGRVGGQRRGRRDRHGLCAILEERVTSRGSEREDERRTRWHQGAREQRAHALGLDVRGLDRPVLEAERLRPSSLGCIAVQFEQPTRWTLLAEDVVGEGSHIDRPSRRWRRWRCHLGRGRCRRHSGRMGGCRRLDRLREPRGRVGAGGVFFRAQPQGQGSSGLLRVRFLGHRLGRAWRVGGASEMPSQRLRAVA